jgi:hypothetical protein
MIDEATSLEGVENRQPMAMPGRYGNCWLRSDPHGGLKMKTWLLAASIILGMGLTGVAQSGAAAGTGSGYNSGEGMRVPQVDRDAIGQPDRGQTDAVHVPDSDPGKPSAQQNRPDPADTNSGSVQPGSVGAMGAGKNQ